MDSLCSSLHVPGLRADEHWVELHGQAGTLLSMTKQASLSLPAHARLHVALQKSSLRCGWSQSAKDGSAGKQLESTKTLAGPE